MSRWRVFTSIYAAHTRYFSFPQSFTLSHASFPNGKHSREQHIYQPSGGKTRDSAIRAAFHLGQQFALRAHIRRRQHVVGVVVMLGLRSWRLLFAIPSSCANYRDFIHGKSESRIIRQFLTNRCIFRWVSGDSLCKQTVGKQQLLHYPNSDDLQINIIYPITASS